MDAVTLHDLAERPDADVVPFRLAGGTVYRTERLGGEHALHLIQWAAVTCFDDLTTIEIESYLGSGGIGHWSRHRTSMKAPGHLAGVPGIGGWNILLTPPGGQSVTVRLAFTGAIQYAGTVAQQRAAWSEYADARSAGIRERRAAEGSGPQDEVKIATRERTAADRAFRAADEAWREAIRAAICAEVSVVDIARLAGGISLRRVYQIRDGRR